MTVLKTAAALPRAVSRLARQRPTPSHRSLNTRSSPLSMPVQRNQAKALLDLIHNVDQDPPPTSPSHNTTPNALDSLIPRRSGSTSPSSSSSQPTASNSSSSTSLSALATANTDQQTRLRALASTARAIASNHRRRLQPGDLVSPADLTFSAIDKFRYQRRTPSRDVFDMLGMNPLSQYANPAVMAEFMTETGRIKTRAQTGLRLVNQRRMAKAVRRAVGLGLVPSTHRHPMLMVKDMEAEAEGGGRRRRRKA